MFTMLSKCSPRYKKRFGEAIEDIDNHIVICHCINLRTRKLAVYQNHLKSTSRNSPATTIGIKKVKFEIQEEENWVPVVLLPRGRHLKR